MSRKNTKPITLNKITLGYMSSGVISSSIMIDKSVKDNDGRVVASDFQTLAENCGFKVIREDDGCNDGFHNKHDQGHPTSIPTTAACPTATCPTAACPTATCPTAACPTATCPDRWSTETCCDPDETICSGIIATDSKADSKQQGNYLDLENEEQESTTPETYLVSRKYGIVAEPTVDFLDMTDNGKPTKSYAHNVDSRNGVCAEEQSCLGPATVQYKSKRDNQIKSAKSEKRKSRNKIMNQNLCHMKSRSRVNRSNVFSLPKLSNQITRRQSNTSNDIGDNKEHQLQIVDTPSVKAEAKITKCNSSSSHFDDACKKETHEHSVINKDKCKRFNNKESINNEMAGSPKEGTSSNYVQQDRGAITSVPNMESIQAFSNINSSCLQQGSGHENQVQTSNSNEEGGMLSYLRKLNIKTDTTQSNKSRGRLKNTSSNQCYSSDNRTFSITSDSKNHRPEIVKKHCPYFNKNKTLFISKKSPLSHHLARPRKASPKRIKDPPRMPRAEFHSSSYERATSGRLSSFSKESNETSESSAPTEENHQHDYNINFNSEDGCDEDICSSSFIGHYLYELWKHQCLCDIRLKVGNTSFLAHKIVLAAFSDLFCPEDPQQIPTLCFDIPDVTEEALCLILQYLYTSEMEISDSCLEAVYMAACVLEIGEVTDLIAEILSKPTTDNFEKYMGIRQRIGLCSNVMDVYRDFVSENLLDIEDSPFILNMSLSQMDKLLRDPDVKIESEEDIIRLIIKWIKYNPCQRSKHAADLLSLVNFDCVGPHVLSSIVEQNRHLFDLASMDIIMAAFKDFALRCKDGPRCADICSSNLKTSKLRSGSCSPMNSRFRDDEACPDTYECQEQSSPDYLTSGGNYFKEQQMRCRKINAFSPQEIRKNATRHCWGKDRGPLECYKNCYQYELNKRNVKPCPISVCIPNSETKYTVRKRKAACDSSNNFPSEWSDQRSRSASSECRCGQLCRRLHSSRSDSDTGHPMSSCYCTPDVPCLRKRTLPARTGNANDESEEANEKVVHDCSSNFAARDRTTNDGRGNGRGSNNYQTCRQSKSSSRSSISSQRYNASSSGSSKRVTFS